MLRWALATRRCAAVGPRAAGVDDDGRGLGEWRLRLIKRKYLADTLVAREGVEHRQGMTAINPNLDDLYHEHGHDPWDTLLPMLLGGVALALVGVFGLWFLSGSPAPSPEGRRRGA